MEDQRDNAFLKWQEEVMRDERQYNSSTNLKDYFLLYGSQTLSTTLILAK